MSPLLIYLLKVNVVVSILFTAYFILLRNEQFFSLNRFFLLGTLILSLVLPLTPALPYSGITQLQQQVAAVNPLAIVYARISEPSTPTVSAKTAEWHGSLPELLSSFSFIQALAELYLLISGLLFLRLVFQLGNLFFFIKRTRTEVSGRICYCQHSLELSPFSFFHYLIINKSQRNSGQFPQIVEHEKVHIRQWHTLDMLFAELVHIFLWINPLFPAIKRYIKLNLEYIADKNVLESGIDKKSYQLSLLSCLNPAAFPLTNLFNSSKIKLRIKMMNSRKMPARNRYKYALVLPLLLLTYFFINPLTAKSLLVPALKKGDSRTVPQQLEAFEGTYQFQKNKKAFIRITAHEDYLILKQLWDGKEIRFEQDSALEFSSKELSFPLKFYKDKDGSIIQVLAFNRDLWDRVKDYKPVVIKDIQLTQQQLKTFEGVYQFQTNKELFLQITAHEGYLILKQLWDNKEIRFTPQSPLEFLSDDKTFPLKFNKDKEGNITQVLAFDRDLWDKVKDYKPVIKKEISLTPEQLKAFEGKYQFQFKKGEDAFIQITAKEGGLVLKQLWDGDEIAFVPESELDFFCKKHPFPLKFYKDKSGAITQVLAFNRDLWNRVKE